MVVNIQPENILQSSFWPEKIRVISVKLIDDGRIKIEAVGLDSQPPQYYNPILSEEDLKRITILEDKALAFDGDAEGLFLYLEAIRIRNAFQFDPHYAVNVSQVHPLPHQIEAVYHYILQRSRIRFLLADDPGAGKTIMAGLLLKELKYRGLVERTLIVVPGHLKDQWLREMKDRFHENFTIVDRSRIVQSWGQNVFTENNQIVVSMDFAKQEDVIYALKDTRWDLCIIDEAHKMSAYKYGDKVNKTQRYTFGETLSPLTNHFLFMTATPHRGDPENFRLFLDLLEPGMFANTDLLAESIQSKDNPLFLRRLKEDLKNFDSTPLFPPRNVDTVKYKLSDSEKKLYNAVTEYVQKHFNKAIEKNNRHVTFALMMLQRRLASSMRAIRKSLERRYNRLQDLHKKGQVLHFGDYSEEYIDDLEESERWKYEDELLEKLTSAESLDELWDEIQRLRELVLLAKNVEKQEIEKKLSELRRVMEKQDLHQSGTKLLIFTESRDTLEYLVEKLKKWGFEVTFIHGGLNLDQKIKAEHEFKNRAQIMVSTEAGGEGINLQFCWLMVNYDIPWNPNRLEQRMGRVHRYGQQHEVFIYNMVAIDTREGMILQRLFEKLVQIKEHMGADRVFDVIGEVIVGKSLKDLIFDAISNRRTMDEILKDFERIPDEEAYKMVRQATLESLATRHIDLSRILDEQRMATENRLVPEYIEAFFKKCSKILKVRMEERQDRFYRITQIPFEVRNQSHEFKIHFGEVQREYLKVSFDKDKAFKEQGEFVSLGHPLLEASVEMIRQKFSKEAIQGAVFGHPDGLMDGVLWFFEAAIRDGLNTVAGKRLFTIYQNFQDKTIPFKAVPPSILWDIKPLQPSYLKQINSPAIESIDIEKAQSYIITHEIETYHNELKKQRQRDASIKDKYGIKSLESMILESEGKLADYETRKMKGENIPDVLFQTENRKKEDLIRKKQNLQKLIEGEVHLYPIEPRLLGAVRIIPFVTDKEPQDPLSKKEVEEIAMRVSMEYESAQERTPEDIHTENLGYDIRSHSTDKQYRYIEVKGHSRDGRVELTPNEWLMARRLQDEYWLYVVIHTASTPQLYIVQNPAEHFRPQEVIDIVRYVVSDWKQKAKVVE